MPTSPWPKVAWWKAGLVAGVTLTLFAVFKGSAKSAAQGDLLSALPGVPFWAKLFAVGFFVGSAYPLVRWIPGPLGRFGDALAGMILMPLYFAACFAVFGQPEIRGEPDAWPLLGLSIPVGAFAGIIIGHDFRKPKTDTTCGSAGS